MQIIPIPAFRDNYLWLLVSGKQATVVDPGEAEPVLAHLAAHGLSLAAVLLTHHHPDHIGGVDALLANRAVPVYGPRDSAMPQVTHVVTEGDTVTVPGADLRVLAVPGHTASHIAYLAPGALFCGDTLFSAGCGRVFDGTVPGLHASLTRLAALPDDTRVYSAHEYTLSNLAFARATEPDNPARDAWAAECERLRAANQPTLPTTIGREKAINPFLRTQEPGVIAAASTHAGQGLTAGLNTFAALRGWKNVF